jgi:uncharacterized metal-binding protein
MIQHRDALKHDVVGTLTFVVAVVSVVVLSHKM